MQPKITRIAASKSRRFTDAARMDIAGTPVRFTTVSPGLCGGTEFSLARLKGDEAKVRLGSWPRLKPTFEKVFGNFKVIYRSRARFD